MTQYEGITVAEAIAKGLADLKLNQAEATIEVVRPESHGFLGLGRKTALVTVALSEAAAVKKQDKREHDIKLDIRHDAKQDPNHRTPPMNSTTSSPNSAVDQQTTTTTVKSSNSVTTEFTRSDDKAVRDLAIYLTDLTQRLGAPSLVRVDQSSEKIIYHLDTTKEGLLIGKHGRSINSLQYLGQTFFNHHAKKHQMIILNVGDYRERRERALTSLAKRSARDVVADYKSVYLDPMPSFERKLIHTILADNPYVETFSEGNEPERHVVIAPRKTVKLV